MRVVLKQSSQRAQSLATKSEERFSSQRTLGGAEVFATLRMTDARRRVSREGTG